MVALSRVCQGQSVLYLCIQLDGSKCYAVLLVTHSPSTAVWIICTLLQWCHGTGNRGQLPLTFSLSENFFFFLCENFLRKSIGRKGLYALKFQKHGCTKQSKILKTNFVVRNW